MTTSVEQSTITVVTGILMLVSVCSAVCPSICACNSNVVTCTSPVSSTMAAIVMEIPNYTNELIVRGSTFRSVSESDFPSVASSLASISVTNGQLQEIRDNAFIELTSLNILNLNDNQISTISTNAFARLTRLSILNLARNRLQTFSSSNVLMSLSNLRNLDLQQNMINDLPEGIFSAQRNLMNLNLEGNQIRNVRSSSLRGLTNLRYFRAGSCKISSIEAGAFAQIPSVNTIDLSYNEISQLPMAQDMQNLRVMQNLTLVGNRISSLMAEQFRGMNLDSLDLSQNTIADIAPMTFSSVIIKHLDLSSNRLVNLPEMVFRNLATQLYTLKLGANPGMQSFPPHFFRDMYMLQELNLAGCSIQEFQEEHFLSVHNLRQLDISYNKLRYLPESLTNRARYMTHVNLESNPWHCNCKINPLRNWLLESRSSFSILYCSNQFSSGSVSQCPPIICTSPQNLAQKEISSLADEEIEKCQDSDGVSAPVGIIVGVCAGVLVAVAIGIGIFCFLWRRHKKGEPLLVCGDDKNNDKRNHEPDNNFITGRRSRVTDPDIGSLNESDKDFVVRNYFHSMVPNPENVSRGNPSLTEKGSYDSTSNFGGTSNGSRFSLNDGYKRESAV